MPHHFLLDLTDDSGRRITLTPETWEEHVEKRPTIRNALDATSEVIQNPDLYGLTPDGAWRYCKRGLLQRWPHLFLQVTIRFEEEGHGRVASIKPVKTPEIEEILWIRDPLPW